MKFLLVSLFVLPSLLFAQEPTYTKGIPNDLAKEKIIFLEHEKIPVTADKKDGKAAKYILLRQTNHNKVINESNLKLQGAALAYPYEYGIATPSTYPSLAKAGYKYVLRSNVYSYKHLEGQPNEDELLIFEYFIHDIENNIAYKVFQMDEMKVYDSKMMIRKLNRAIKHSN
ncbi:MAG: hypothetical protein JKY48_08415 [Flavobacteriales bacterium]|nr:hypothetical protein [Flavobacteriales bacterium]